jgi:cell division transport system permease protein
MYKLPKINVEPKKSILQMGSSLKLLFKRHWASLLITSFFSGCLFTLPAIFHLLNQQINQLTNNANQQQEITAFLQPNIKKSQNEQILEKILQIPNVGNATFLDKDISLKKIQHIKGINAAINALGGYNPLHNTIVITPKKILSSNEAKILKEKISKISYITDVALDEQWITFMAKISNKLSQYFTIFIFLTALTAGTLMFYFMLVRCMNSHAEMKLKFYLGAYPWQIYQPYIGFGLTIGLLSGIIAIFLISLSYYLYTSIWEATIAQELFSQQLLPPEIPIYIIFISIFLSLISSSIATYLVRKNILKDYIPIQ